VGHDREYVNWKSVDKPGPSVAFGGVIGGMYAFG